jgi:hypothetical protein
MVYRNSSRQYRETSSMDVHDPLAMSILRTLQEDLLFSLKQNDEEGTIEDGISSPVLVNVRVSLPTGEQSIPFTEMPGPHYRGIVWAHFSRLGSAWAMHISVGIPHSSSLSSSSSTREVQQRGPITILRMDFLDEPSSQTDGSYMVEADIYTEEDWAEFKSRDLEHWIERGLDMETEYEQALSEDETVGPA